MGLEGPPPDALPETIQHAASSSSNFSRVVSLALLLVSVTFAVFGQLTLKTAMDRIGRIGHAQLSSLGDTLGRALREPRLWAGLILFGVSAVFWLVVLSRVRLSVAYPLVGISYIVIVLLARYRLHEHVPMLRWLGVIVIAIGIAIIGFSFRRATGS